MAKSDKHAAIYFDKANNKSMIELAKRLRSSGARTTLIWGSKFTGSEAMQPEARAVLIQKGCANAKLIESTYRKLAHDVEIHYIGIDGEFIEQEAVASEEGDSSRETREVVAEADSAMEAETVDNFEGSRGTTIEAAPIDDGENSGASATAEGTGTIDPSEPPSH